MKKEKVKREKENKNLLGNISRKLSNNVTKDLSPNFG